MTPGRATRSATSASRAGVDTSKSSARLAWLAASSSPSDGRSSAASASTNRRTRSFSVTTWRARRRTIGSSMRSSAPTSADVAQRADDALGRLALLPASGVGRPGQGAGLAGVHGHHLQVLGQGHGRDGERAAVEQQRVARPPRPRTPSWSITPQGTPDARCSARCASRARGRGSGSAPRARASATSSAALDDRPAPIGSVVETVPVKPVGRADLGHHAGHVAGPPRGDGRGRRRRGARRPPRRRRPSAAPRGRRPARRARSWPAGWPSAGPGRRSCRCARR